MLNLFKTYQSVLSTNDISGLAVLPISDILHSY